MRLPWGNAWLGAGFTSDYTNGGNNPKNNGDPWMIIYLSGVSLDRPLNGSCFYGPASSANGFNNSPEARITSIGDNYQDSIVLRITINAKTREVSYAVNGKEAATARIDELDPRFVFFQGFNSGDSVEVQEITLSAKPAD
jgi:hypothetical protein